LPVCVASKEPYPNYIMHRTGGFYLQELEFKFHFLKALYYLLSDRTFHTAGKQGS